MEKPDLGRMGNFNYDMIEMLCSFMRHTYKQFCRIQSIFGGYLVYLEY